MKKILFAALPTATIALLLTTGFSDPLPLGAPIPNAELKMKDVSGKAVALKDVKKANGLLVMFSCNTCPYVIKNQARTAEVGKYAMGNDIGFVILNSNEANRGGDDSFGEMKEYASSQRYNWFYLVDENSTMADAFGANRTPECFLFDKEGKLVYHGAIDDNPSNSDAVNRKHLIAAIDEMKSGKDITVKQSRSVGCTIKRIK